MKTRKVYPGEVHHVCQQTVGGVLVFYTVSDFLVYFTIVCTMAGRFGIRILALCPMADHTHLVVVASGETELARFVQQYTHLFSREWNKSRGRKGPLFKHRYMSSVKLGNKQAQTTINYCNNNPVERKLVKEAQDYRWNFLHYARKAHPYSSGLNSSCLSKKMRDILREARRIRQGSGHLQYSQLERWRKYLNGEQIQFLFDSIIGLWNVIDYGEAISYYGNYDAMLRSFHDNTGSDYDISEDRSSYSDAVYADCTRILLKEGHIGHPREIPSLPLSLKKALADELRRRTTALPRQIAKYLHLGLDN